MKELLLQYVYYNFWANNKISITLFDLSDELMNKVVQSSFTSLRETVGHISDAEMIWISRLKGVSVDHWPSQNIKVSTEEFLNQFTSISKAWCNFIENQDDSILQQDCFYKDIAQEEHREKVHGIVMHCMNHSTFHRGQIISILRQIGLKQGLPSTDMITFLREEEIK
jgi:uncharacterized damage-inducible protein DinB